MVQQPVPGGRWWHQGQHSSFGLSLQEFKSDHQLPLALRPCPDHASILCPSILIYKTGLCFPPHTVVVMIR